MIARSIGLLLKSRAFSRSVAISAIDSPDLSHHRLYEQSVETVSWLRRMGIHRNDRVAIALPNGPEAAVAFLAVSSGATCAPLNPNYRVSEYEFYLKDLAAKVLIVQVGVAEPARVAARTLNIPIIELSPVSTAEAGIFRLSDGAETFEAETLGTVDFAEPEDTALILHTSGTTARPKMVPLTHTNLLASAQNIKTVLALSEGDRCLNVMPLFHIHGLMGALLSSISTGASVVCTPGFYAPQFFDWVQKTRPTWYSAVPTMHQQILSRAARLTSIEQPSIRFIRSSSAPLPPQVMTELERVFKAPVIESYGMTEASHQMASNPLPPRQRKSGSVGIAAGPAVQIMDEQGALLSVGETGEVVVQGNNVTQGYANNPEANNQAFTNGWFRTGDLGFLDSDGYLFLKGRIKEIINRGGEKISPREVDEVLLYHPAIAQVVTFAAPHTHLGEEVAAAVVLCEDATVSEQSLKEFAAKKLADFKIPRVVLFLDDIPKGPTGKRQRIGLAEKLGLTTSDPAADRTIYIAPQTPVEKTLANIWEEVLGIEPIGLQDNFFQLGGDSILSAQIINRVRAELQAELSFLIFFQQPTLANMAISITQLQSETVDADEMAQLLAELETFPEEKAQQLL